MKIHLILIISLLSVLVAGTNDAVLLYKLPEPFRVLGRASGSLAAEQVMLNFMVETLNLKANESLSQNSEILNSAISGFKSLGLTENELVTSGLQIYPSFISHYDQKTGQYSQEFEGYRVKNSLSITTKKIDIAGKIIDEAIRCGVTHVISISYAPLAEHTEKHKESLLAEAVANAKKKAKIVLNELNYKIESIKSIQIIENQQRYMAPEAAPEPAGGARKSTHIYASTEAQEVQVEVAFIIEPKHGKNSHENEL